MLPDQQFLIIPGSSPNPPSVNHVMQRVGKEVELGKGLAAA